MTSLKDFIITRTIVGHRERRLIRCKRTPATSAIMRSPASTPRASSCRRAPTLMTERHAWTSSGARSSTFSTATCSSSRCARATSGSGVGRHAMSASCLLLQPISRIRQHRWNIRKVPCPRYQISTTGIAQHHAVAAARMNAFAEIIRCRARFSSDPDLITRQRASAAFEQDRVPLCQHRRMALLERSISIQHVERDMSLPRITPQGCIAPAMMRCSRPPRRCSASRA